MTHRHTLRSLEDLARSDAWVAAILDDDRRLGASDRLRIRLAVHELVVNVIEHAYADGEGRIEVTLDVTGDRLHVVVVDEGRAFAGSSSRALPERPSDSGYGLPIIGAVFDDVTYTRTDTTNTWRLSFATGAPQESGR